MLRIEVKIEIDNEVGVEDGMEVGSTSTPTSIGWTFRFYQKRLNVTTDINRMGVYRPGFVA